ncbi:MAG: Crp/Fnr family transcriptional regulator [Anaerolineae bacterium]|nr:Crp/Fnr family transcriptional regulator [Gemmatimonadaceae bacterium]
MKPITRLSRACRDSLTNYAARTTWPAGFTVYERDSQADGVFIVLFGQIVLRSQLALGREYVPWVAAPGETFGDEGLQKAFCYVSTARAEEESETLHLSSASFNALMREQPALAMALVRQMVSERTSLLQKQGEHYTLTVEERLVISLIRLECSREGDVVPGSPARNGSASPRLADAQGATHIFSRRLLGELVGATRESISLVLARLTGEGLVRREGSGLVVTDFDGLMAKIESRERPHPIEIHEERQRLDPVVSGQVRNASVFHRT